MCPTEESIMKLEDALNDEAFCQSVPNYGGSRTEIRRAVEQAFMVLGALGDGAKRLVRAAWSDPRVTYSEWRQLVSLVLVSPDKAGAVRRWGRANVLKGDECNTDPPLGRVVSRDDLVMLIAEEIKAMPSAVRRYVDMLAEAGTLWEGIAGLYGLSAASSYRYEGGVPMGRYVMWCTFSSESSDPFFDLEADDVPAALGLTFALSEGDYLAVVYELPPELRARWPRVVEAAASSVWNPYFEPRLDGALPPWGMTVPVPGRGLPARPEVVHEPVEINRLRSVKVLR
jgi:hypothetical protein